MQNKSDPLPTLDVVLPYYNEEAELIGCLDLLVHDKDIKNIILVNNNSSDSSPTIARTYAERDERITLIDEAQRGVQYARDAGISKTSSDIIARIDADTRVQPGWGKAIRQFYHDNSDMAAASGAYEFYDLPFRRLANFTVWLFLIMGNRLIAGNHSLYGANMSIRRTVWSNIRSDIIDAPRIMEDLSIAIAIDLHHGKVGYIPGALAYVSGRRMRTSPRNFKKYNDQWWRTYQVYGFSHKARVTRIVSWIGNVGHFFSGFVLRFHDPTTGKFRISNFRKHPEDRVIP